MKKHIRNIAVLTVLTTAAIHVINRIISITSTMKNLLKKDYGQFFDWKYGKIFYTQHGKGSPVLLIHDLNPCSSAMEWNQIYKYLSKNHTVYSLDLLGCGRSDKPNLTYTNYLYVQLLTDFIKNVIHEKTNLIATGTSCSFSIMSCNMDPEYYNKIILINPESLTELTKIPSKGKNAFKFMMDLPIIGTMLYHRRYCKANIKRKFYQQYFEKSHVIADKTLDMYYESAHLGNSKGKYLQSSMDANYTNIHIVHALKKINNSIFIIGSKEQEDCTEILKSYQKYNPSIEAAEIPHSKYLPQMEVPEKFLNQLTVFLESV